MSLVQATTTPHDRSGNLNIGIQLDPDALRLVAVQHGHIRAWSNLPFPPGMTTASTDFFPFLKRALQDFGACGRNSNVWALGAFSSLQLRCFSVPRSKPGHLSNMVYWTFRKEIPFDAALSVFDYDSEGEQADKREHGMTVTAYTVLQKELDALHNLFQQAGCRLKGIVIPHFAMRNLFRAHWLNHDPTVASLYVGGESSTIQIISGGHVVLSRVFITGLNAILDALRDRHPEWSPAEAFNRLHEAEGADTAELWEVSRSALGRLMQQVERTIAAHLVGRGTGEIKRIHVMGALATLPRLVEAMGAQSGIHTEPACVLNTPHMAAHTNPPSNPNEAALLTLAAGVALSTARQTPNLLHTYVKRDREVRKRRFRTIGVTAAAAALALLLVGYGATAKRNQMKRREMAMVNAQAAMYPEALSRDRINRMLADAQDRLGQLRASARTCRPIALVSHLADLTPADIRLIAIRITPDDGPAGRRSQETWGDRIQLDGMVRGMTETQEARLASYVMRLEDANLFEAVSVARTLAGSDGTEPVILFEVEMRAVFPHPEKVMGPSLKEPL